MTDNDVEILFNFIIDWGAKNGFEFIVPNEKNENEFIDFININVKTKRIYVGSLDINESLVDDL